MLNNPLRPLTLMGFFGIYFSLIKISMNMDVAKFFGQAELNFESLPWGKLATVSGPETCGAKDLIVLDVVLLPGQGHNFHKHPQQEEVIYVLEGSVEQWLGEEKRILQPGDSACIPADCVHASFNVGDADAKVLAILGPAIGETGYEVEEVADQAPWNSLR
jgi:quercetin dioxygenase-like cupin family protein